MSTKWLWLIIAGAAVARMPAIVDSISTPQVIEAQEFRLVDAEGNLRLAIGFDTKDGTPVLVLYDTAGELRVVLGLMKDGTPSLALWDAASKGRALLGFTEGGTSGLALYDAAGKRAALFGFTEDGTSGLDFYDASGDVIWQAPE